MLLLGNNHMKTLILCGIFNFQIPLYPTKVEDFRKIYGSLTTNLFLLFDSISVYLSWHSVPPHPIASLIPHVGLLLRHLPNLPAVGDHRRAQHHHHSRTCSSLRMTYGAPLCFDLCLWAPGRGKTRKGEGVTGTRWGVIYIRLSTRVVIGVK